MPFIQAKHYRIALIFLVAIFGIVSTAFAHPLGNFTINHFTRLELESERIRIRYVVDLAEIPAFQEMQLLGVGTDEKPSEAALNDYLERVAGQYADGLILEVDGARVPLQINSRKITMPAGAGGLPTLRVECELTGNLTAISMATSGSNSSAGSSTVNRHLRFEDTNYRERTGWREMVVVPTSGVSVFDSNVYGNAVTDELKAYPQDMLAAPLDERRAELSWTTGPVPSGAKTLLKRDGRPVAQTRDQLAELISVQELTPGIALFSLVIAVALGGLHAFSPGHGKTVVGAYLVGSRGTPRHAAFLGLTVTITHTLGVFALGLVTLFAAQYVVPEKLFPILSFVSGAIVLTLGLSIFIRRLGAVLNSADDDQSHHGHTHEGTTSHEEDLTIPHSHGGRVHTHLPPGADNSPITWRSLLALGISGGLLPCPSALVVLLSAISLHRVGFGLLLVVAFSLGLAATLTGIGLAFLYAGRLLKRPAKMASGGLVRVLPVVSAFVIMCVGVVICYEALVQAGFHLSGIVGSAAVTGSVVNSGASENAPHIASMGAFAVLGLGLVFGLKHATEVDHVVAVSTIVSEHRNLLRATLVGGLWGAGHTLSLLIVGVVVLALRIAIPERVANWLEFGVALMIIWLGVSALMRVRRKRAEIGLPEQDKSNWHQHVHGSESGWAAHGSMMSHTHAVRRVGFKPLVVGMVHGLAGSAALTLLVLTQIESALLGLLYLIIFGVGSIFGMLLMSGLVGLPFAFSSRKLSGVHYSLQIVAGALSIGFGLWYAYQTSLANGIWN